MKYIWILLLWPSIALATINDYLHKANGKIATIYGVGEMDCGSKKRPRRCTKGALTSTGIPLDPHNVATAALSLPVNYLLKPLWVYLKLEGGNCVRIRLIDKKSMNEHSPWDLTPAAIIQLGAKASRTWSGRVYLCEVVPTV